MILFFKSHLPKWLKHRQLNNQEHANHFPGTIYFPTKSGRDASSGRGFIFQFGSPGSTMERTHPATHMISTMRFMFYHQVVPHPVTHIVSSWHDPETLLSAHSFFFYFHSTLLLCINKLSSSLSSKGRTPAVVAHFCSEARMGFRFSMFCAHFHSLMGLFARMIDGRVGGSKRDRSYLLLGPCLVSHSRIEMSMLCEMNNFQR